MDVEIVAIGTEFLFGRRTDTNSPWIAAELARLGAEVRGLRAVDDHERRIEVCLRACLESADVVVATGGLGPTADDVTRKAAARLTGAPLVYHEDLAADIEGRFAARGVLASPSNRLQAFLPRGAWRIENPLGTAPGFSLEVGRKMLFFLPGVPAEMRRMFTDSVRPVLAARMASRRSVTLSRVYRTTGLGESALNDRIRDLFEFSPNLSVAVLANDLGVDVCLTARAPDEAAAEALLDALGKRIMERLPNHTYGQDGDDLETLVGKLLSMRGATVATAESCTGGLLAERLTRVPGSSGWFRRGFVVYADAAKSDLLGVDAALLAAGGAVSAGVARALAEGCRASDGASFGIGITGVAGPTGGTEAKPVGLVHLALAGEDGTESLERRFAGDRLAVRAQAAQAALEMLRRHLLGLPLEG